jgi:hypothetical protein
MLINGRYVGISETDRRNRTAPAQFPISLCFVHNRRYAENARPNFKLPGERRMTRHWCADWADWLWKLLSKVRRHLDGIPLYDGSNTAVREQPLDGHFQWKAAQSRG